MMPFGESGVGAAARVTVEAGAAITWDGGENMPNRSVTTATTINVEIQCDFMFIFPPIFVFKLFSSRLVGRPLMRNP